MNVSLVGFMGSGKTAVGKKVAEKMGFDFVDTDDLVEEGSGKKISEIFEKEGEETFRNLERTAVKKAGEMDNVVIATGGGAVLSPENLENLRKNGPVVLLKVSAEQALERVRNEKHRPLLAVADPLGKIRELLETRQKFYELADHQIDTEGKTPEQIADEIVHLIKSDSSAALAASDSEAFE